MNEEDRPIATEQEARASYLAATAALLAAKAADRAARHDRHANEAKMRTTLAGLSWALEERAEAAELLRGMGIDPRTAAQSQRPA